jgi:hypothetical protein
MITMIAQLCWSFRRLTAPSRNSLVVSLRSASDSAVLVECGSSMIRRSPRCEVSEPNGTPSRVPVDELAKLVSAVLVSHVGPQALVPFGRDQVA